MKTKLIPDVIRRETRVLAVTDPTFSPGNVIVAADYTSPEGEMLHYPVEVRRKDLLAALGAEPDESDYAEVLAENRSLGTKLAKALRERDTAIKDRDAAERERDSWERRAEQAVDAAKERDARNAELLERARAAEEASEGDPEEQAQFDRSWALEKAAGVLGGLAAVGALPKDYAGAPLVHLAEWILNGPKDDDE